MIAAAVTAHFTHLNKAVAVISSNISIPPMIPFILYGSYWTGAQVLQRDMPLSLSDITLERVAADLITIHRGQLHDGRRMRCGRDGGRLCPARTL